MQLSVSVKFEDFSHQRGLLYSDFGHLGKNMNDLRSYLLEGFKRALDSMRPLVQSWTGTFQEVQILVISGKSPEHNNTLAYFDPLRSARDHVYSFGIYYDTVKPWLAQAWGGAANAGTDSLAAWSHELIHMLDFNSIYGFVVEMDHSIGIEKERHATPFSGDHLEYPRHWYLLQVFSTIRAEGIAVLCEGMLFGERLRIEERSSDQQTLQQLISGIGSVLLRGDLQSLNTHETLGELLTFARAHAYVVGPGLVLGALAGETPPSADACALLSRSIQPNELGRERVFALLRRALQIDLSEFLQHLLSAHGTDPGLRIEGGRCSCRSASSQGGSLLPSIQTSSMKSFEQRVATIQSD